MKARIAVKRPVVMITGAAGFLGSALAVDLAADHDVAALDIRRPSRRLRRAAGAASWLGADIGDRACVAEAFRAARRRFGRIHFVLHFAAFYHFGDDPRPEYERTNVEGTRHVLQAAAAAGVRRVVFASSVAALAPGRCGRALTEQTSPSGTLPYARSKALGEALVRQASGRTPGVVLRIGGAFSDWCELPPLASLIRLWAGRSPLRRLVPGRGASGIPYIHRREVVRAVRRCLERHERLSSWEVFLAAEAGTVRHRELYAAIRRLEGEAERPWLVPVGALRAALPLRRAAGWIAGRPPFERSWMLDYVDRPWIVDVRGAQARLGWSCSGELRLLARLPELLRRFHGARAQWERRNRLREAGRCVFSR